MIKTEELIQVFLLEVARQHMALEAVQISLQ
jgi:hypothetical protein